MLQVSKCENHVLIPCNSLTSGNPPELLAMAPKVPPLARFPQGSAEASTRGASDLDKRIHEESCSYYAWHSASFCATHIGDFEIQSGKMSNESKIIEITDGMAYFVPQRLSALHNVHPPILGP